MKRLIDINTITTQAIKEIKKQMPNLYDVQVIPVIDGRTTLGAVLEIFFKTQITKAIKQSFAEVRVEEQKYTNSYNNTDFENGYHEGYRDLYAQRIKKEKEFLCSSHNQKK